MCVWVCLCVFEIENVFADIFHGRQLLVPVDIVCFVVELSVWLCVSL